MLKWILRVETCGPSTCSRGVVLAVSVGAGSPVPRALVHTDNELVELLLANAGAVPEHRWELNTSKDEVPERAVRAPGEDGWLVSSVIDDSLIVTLATRDNRQRRWLYRTPLSAEALARPHAWLTHDERSGILTLTHHPFNVITGIGGTGVVETAWATQSELRDRLDGGTWVSGPTWRFGNELVQALTELTSERRLVLRWGAGDPLSVRELSARIGFVGVDSPRRRALAARFLNVWELVVFEWGQPESR